MLNGNQAYVGYPSSLEDKRRCGGDNRGGVSEPHGYSFMLAYWYSRRHGIIDQP
jgi:hypothetical protein